MDTREIVTGEVRASRCIVVAEVRHSGYMLMFPRSHGVQHCRFLDHIQAYDLVSRPLWGDQ